MGPARGAALPGHRRPARRLARTSTPTTPPTSASSATAGPSAATRSRRSWPATTCRTAGSTSSATTEAQRLVELAGAAADDLPLVLLPDGETAALPDDPRAGRARWACAPRPQQPLYDVCIVGGGPAGLAAAVYAASEGLSTVIVEREAPGGQAGTSAAIENYLGFPKGLSGADLTQRAIAQVSRFGAEMVLARDVVGVRAARAGARRAARRRSGEIEARAVIVATGVSYRRLEADGLDDAHRPRRLLRRRRERRAPVRGRRRLHRRRGQLRGPGRAQPGPLRQARGLLVRPGGRARGDDVAVPRRPHRGVAEHRGAHRQRGAWRLAATATSRR